VATAPGDSEVNPVFNASSSGVERPSSLVYWIHFSGNKCIPQDDSRQSPITQQNHLTKMKKTTRDPEMLNEHKKRLFTFILSLFYVTARKLPANEKCIS
jgi:hypothetical protein